MATPMRSADVTLLDGATGSKQKLAEVDRNYFTLFLLPVVAGDPAAPLVDPDTQTAASGHFAGNAKLNERMARPVCKWDFRMF